MQAASCCCITYLTCLLHAEWLLRVALLAKPPKAGLAGVDLLLLRRWPICTAKAAAKTASQVLLTLQGQPVCPNLLLQEVDLLLLL